MPLPAYRLPVELPESEAATGDLACSCFCSKHSSFLHWTRWPVSDVISPFIWLSSFISQLPVCQPRGHVHPRCRKSAAAAAHSASRSL